MKQNDFEQNRKRGDYASSSKNKHYIGIAT